MNARKSAPVIPNWLLRSRVSPPRHALAVITRTRVLQDLAAVPSGSVLLINAPPGYGKTVLLSQLVKARAASGVRCAWLTLDALDEPESALSYLAFAFLTAGLDPAASELCAETAARPANLALKLQTLLGMIEQSNHSWFLVLDDLERASREVITAVINPLLRLMPGALCVVLGTREPVTVDTSTLEGRGLVHHVGVAQLRFDRDEVRTMWGRSTSEHQVRTVEQRTGGWPALVQLLRHQGGALHFGRDYTVSSFFEASILKRLPERILALLMRLSLLPCFDAEFVEPVLKVPAAEPDIRALLSLGIVRFVAPQGPLHLEVHPLFREYCAERYALSDLTDVRDFQKAAALAYLKFQRYVQAVELAVATGDSSFIATLVESCDPLSLWAKQGFTQLRDLMRPVPAEVAGAHPTIGYVWGIYLAKSGRLKEAQALFDGLESKLTGSTPSGARSQQRIAVARSLCCHLLLGLKGTAVSAASAKELRRTAKLGSDLHPFLRSIEASLRYLDQERRGKFAIAKRVAQKSIRYAEEAGSPSAAFYCYCDLGMIAGVEGSPEEAMRLLQAASRVWHVTTNTDEALTTLRDAFELELRHEMNPKERASIPRLKNMAASLPRLEVPLDVYVAIYRTLSEKLYLSGDISGALAALSLGIGHARSQEIERLPVVLMSQRVLLLASAGRLQEASAELAALEPGSRKILTSPTVWWREAEALVEACATLDICGQTDHWLTQLGQAIAWARKGQNLRSELRFRRLRIALAEVGECATEIRRTDSTRVRQLEQQSGYRRCAADFATLAVSASERTMQEPAPGRNTSTSYREFFTPQQLLVLEKLSQGLPDKAIAGDLHISTNGVRYHLKRIYAKLQAGSRGEASQKAKQLGLFIPTTQTSAPY